MYIKDLMFEITRRCQLGCEHCLRGDAEPVDMSPYVIDEVLNGVTQIGNVVFTGGEPFLKPDLIHHFCDVVQTRGIEVDIFFIATNGMVFDEYNRLSSKSLSAIARLHQLVEYPESSSVKVSRDQYHCYEYSMSSHSMLDILKLAYIDEVEYDPKGIILMGRAAEYGLGTRELNVPISLDDVEELVDADFYVTARGEVVWECNLSYELMDDISISIEQAKAEYAKRQEMEVDYE